MLPSLSIPVIAAPMAGGPSTPELVASVTTSGGFGFLAGGYLGADALAAQIQRCRDLTDAPFGVNLFVPGRRSNTDLTSYTARMNGEADRYQTEPGASDWDDDNYPAKLELVLRQRIPVVSSTFGLPAAADLARLHEIGTTVVATVTTPAEARLAAQAGVDLLCVQGFEAGGHRATFADDPASPTGGPLLGLLSALRLIEPIGLPMIAAGGIVHGADLAAVLAAGAIAAQCGTAFLRCPEAGTAAPQRAALADGTRATTLTRAFSGRIARGLANRFIRSHTEFAPAAYPQLHRLTRPIRAAAAKAGDPDGMSLWAGQTYPLATEAPAAEVLRTLHEQARAAATRMQDLLGH